MNGFLGSAEGFASALLPALWRASWQGAMAIVAVWLVTRVFSLSPRIVCWAWRLVCVKMLVALVWMQPIELPVLPREPVVVASAKVAEPLRATDASDDAAITQTQALSPARIQSTQTVEHSIAWQTWLALGWCAGVALCIAVTLRQWRQVRKVRVECSAPETDCLADWIAEEAARLRIRRRPSVLLANTEGPLLIGVVRPAIVLPVRAVQLFDEAELRLMIRHELAHLQRRDLVWNWLPTVVSWLFFFHPLTWLMKRGWFESQEAACDETLIQNQAARPAEYGRLLVKLATHWPSGLPTSVAAAGVLGVYQNLERRIKTMIHVKAFSKRRIAAIGSLMAIAALVMIVPWRLVADDAVAMDDVSEIAKQIVETRRDLKQGHIVLSVGKYGESAQRLEYYFDGDKSRLDRWYRTQGGRPNLQVVITNERQITGKGKVGWEVQLRDPEDKRLFAGGMPDPRRLGLVAWWIDTWDQFSWDVAIRTPRPDGCKDFKIKQETVNGLPLLKVSYEKQMKRTGEQIEGADIVKREIWFSTSQGNLPVYFSTSSGEGKDLYVDSLECELQKFGTNGVWFPKKTIFRYAREGQLVIEQICIVEKATFGESLRDDLFTLDGLAAEKFPE
jgi:beta-lactamase regulating signal transducer with metallopeptidase domain